MGSAGAVGSIGGLEVGVGLLGCVSCALFHIVHSIESLLRRCRGVSMSPTRSVELVNTITSIAEALPN